MPTTGTSPATTPAPLDDRLVRDYVDQGFLVMPGLLSAAELAALKAELAGFASGRYPGASLRSPASTDGCDPLLGILCIHMPHYVSTVIRDAIAHPRISAVLARIVGAHLAHWDGSVKCMQSMFFVKPPGLPGQAWHQDELYIPTRDRSLCGAWIAIDDATVANGCLRVIPGSHRNGYLHPQHDHGRPDEFDFGPESHGFDESAEIPVEARAGSVIFFNGHLLHRSLRNRSTSFRRALVGHYMNAWSLLPWRQEARFSHDRLPSGIPEYRVGIADYRVVTPIAGDDPYAWKGYESGDPDQVWLRPYRANP